MRPASEGEPIVFETQTITVKRGEDSAFTYSMFNNQDKDLESVILKLKNCSENREISLLTVKSSIEKDHYVTFKGVLSIPKFTSDGTTKLPLGRIICEFTISADNNTDFGSKKVLIDIVK